MLKNFTFLMHVLLFCVFFYEPFHKNLFPKKGLANNSGKDHYDPPIEGFEPG